MSYYVASISLSHLQNIGRLLNVEDTYTPESNHYNMHTNDNKYINLTKWTHEKRARENERERETQEEQERETARAGMSYQIVHLQISNDNIVNARLVRTPEPLTTLIQTGSIQSLSPVAFPGDRSAPASFIQTVERDNESTPVDVRDQWCQLNAKRDPHTPKTANATTWHRRW